MTGAQLSWLLGTLLPGLAVLLGGLKWLIRVEMRPHRDKLRALANQVRDTDHKVNRIYSILLRERVAARQNGHYR